MLLDAVHDMLRGAELGVNDSRSFDAQVTAIVGARATAGIESAVVLLPTIIAAGVGMIEKQLPMLPAYSMPTGQHIDVVASLVFVVHVRAGVRPSGHTPGVYKVPIGPAPG
jgi:hypothetical protein